MVDPKLTESLPASQIVSSLRDFANGCGSEAPHVLFARFLADRLEQRGDASMGTSQFITLALANLQNLAEGGRAGKIIVHPLSTNRAALEEIELAEVASAFCRSNTAFFDATIAELGNRRAEVRGVLRGIE